MTRICMAATVWVEWVAWVWAAWVWVAWVWAAWAIPECTLTILTTPIILIILIILTTPIILTTHT